jgi:uncharacterized coiled-coil DUF342 family protein
MTPLEKLGGRIANALANLDKLVKEYDLVNEVILEYEWALDEADKECESLKATIEALQQENMELTTQLSVRNS